MTEQKKTTPTVPTNCNYTITYCILGDPGAVSGGRKSRNGREKNPGEEKSRTRKRPPGDKVVTDQVQTVGVVLASDLFFLPSHKAARPGVVSGLLTRMHIGQLLAICLLEEKKFQSQHRVSGRSFGISVRNSPQIRWTFRRYRNVSAFKRQRRKKKYH